MWTRKSFIKSVLALAICAVTLTGLTSGIAYSAPGDLDPAFDVDGLVTTNFHNTSDEARAIVIQPDGKIITVGTTLINDDNNNFSVARYDPDGSPDNSFSEDGHLTTDIQANYNDAAYAAALQPDGRIVVVGHVMGVNFAAVRYLPDGSLDTTFDDDGRGNYHYDYEAAYAVAVQGDGKIVLAGYVFEFEEPADFALLRLNPDGSIDTTFDDDGWVITDFFGGVDEIHAMQILPDGKILVGGYAQVSGFNYDVALALYNPDGSLDSGFGAGGKVTTDFFGGDDGATSLAVQPDGHIVAAGAFYSASQGYDFGVVRYLPNGELDTSFDSDGLQDIFFAAGTATEVANGVAIQPSDGKIVVAGYAPVDGINDFALLRLNPDGSLDGSFGVGGRVTHDFGGGVAIAYGVAIQADGKIVTAGTAYMDDAKNYDYALARYILVDPPPPPPPTSYLLYLPSMQK